MEDKETLESLCNSRIPNTESEARHYDQALWALVSRELYTENLCQTSIHQLLHRLYRVHEAFPALRGTAMFRIEEARPAYLARLKGALTHFASDDEPDYTKDELIDSWDDTFSVFIDRLYPTAPADYPGLRDTYSDEEPW